MIPGTCSDYVRLGLASYSNMYRVWPFLNTIASCIYCVIFVVQRLFARVSKIRANLGTVQCISVHVFSCFFFCPPGLTGLAEHKRFRPRRGPEDGQVGFERHHRQRRVVLELWPAVVRCTGRERDGRTATGEALAGERRNERRGVFYLVVSVLAFVPGVSFCVNDFYYCCRSVYPVMCVCKCVFFIVLKKKKNVQEAFELQLFVVARRWCTLLFFATASVACAFSTLDGCPHPPHRA